MRLRHPRVSDSAVEAVELGAELGVRTAATGGPPQPRAHGLPAAMQHLREVFDLRAVSLDAHQHELRTGVVDVLRPGFRPQLVNCGGF